MRKESGLRVAGTWALVLSAGMVWANVTRAATMIQSLTPKMAELDVSPVMTAPPAPPIVITYYDNVDDSIFSSDDIVINSRMIGQRGYSQGITGPSISLTLDKNFLPGENVWVTARSTIRDSSANPMVPWTWSFITQVLGGNTLLDSGQSLGSLVSSDVAFGDIDGDGDMDAVVASNGSDHQVYLNDGTGQFTATTALSNTGSASAVALADVDGDLDLDVVIAVNGGTNQIWIGAGNGSFTAATGFGGSAATRDVALADLDQDGDVDIFEVNDSTTVGNRIWFNNGLGIFSDSGQELGTCMENVCADPSGTPYPRSICGTSAPISYDRSDAVALADVNNDGLVDVVVAELGLTATVWRNFGGGNFTGYCSPTSQYSLVTDFDAFASSGQAQGVALGDLDGDGYVDAFIARGGLSARANQVWMNNGTGGFSNSQQALGSLDSYDVRLFDLDADGDLDALVANSGSSASASANELWRNDGSGDFGFEPVQNLIVEGKTYEQTYGIDVADIDGDGDMDAYFSNVGTSSNSDSVWINNTSPVVDTNTGMTLGEGSRKTITSAMLSSADSDDGDSGLLYTLTVLPGNGQIELDSVTLSVDAQFTQNDINLGRLSYLHNGSETASDSFSFTVEDPNGAVTEEQDFMLTITPVNDAPIVDVNIGATTSEGGSVVLGNTQLRATDADDDDLILLFTVTVAPANGQVLKQGSVTTSFTQDDINNGRISYTHNGGESTTDQFSFTVADDGGASTSTQVFNLNISPVNDAPTVTTNFGLVTPPVDEGTAATITNTVLLASDVDDTNPSTLTFTVIQLPVNGVLKNGAATLGANGTFTQGDINTSKVTYTHDGSETTSDSFRFVVTDPSSAQAPAETFAIVVNPVNDPPVVVVNTGLGLAEGALATIGSGRLQSTDPDDIDGDLIYTLTQIPSNGVLQNVGVALALGESFTQADIDSNAISYQHTASGTTTDSFRFTVSDGALSTTATSFAITISAVNDPPTVDVNAGATVAEGSTVGIDNTILLASDPEDGAASLSYRITQAPINGTLTNGVTALGANSVFTQADINNNNISYTHNGSETLADSFQFVVTDSGSLSAPAETFSIDVTAVNDSPQVVVNARVTLDEGATVTVGAAKLQSTDADNVDSGLIYQATIIPGHGSLLLNDVPVIGNGTFTQDDINTGKLTYRHDGGESTADSFSFTVTDGTNTTAAQAFSFDVTPVNDAPQIVHNTGLTLDEGATAAISNAALSASDVDNDDSSLNFRLTQAPVNGSLRNGVNTIKLNDNFTQSDIDTGKISYVHNGSETTADSFRIVVSDAQNAQAPAATFSITINSINDAPVVNANLGLTVAEAGGGTISNVLLRASDVDNVDQDLVFTVTQVPVNGTLLNGVSVLLVNGTFTQGDIDANALTYTHNGSETTGDSFRFTVGDGSATTSPAIFAIAVTAVNDAPTLAGSHDAVPVNEGGNVVITQTMLSATDPDNDDGGLLYTLTGLPAHGAVLNGVTPLAINAKFTQSDINSGTISYQHDDSETLTDSFQVRVTDPLNAAAPAATFGLAVTAVNDVPVIAVNTGLSVIEGGSADIGSGRLQATDPDNTADELVFTLTVVPSNGELQLGGTPLAVDGTFSQTQIDAGALRYVHNASQTTTDSFQYRVSDGSASTAVTLFPITISATNNAPSIVVNTGVTLAEGATVLIANTMLAATDPDDNDGELRYTLTAIPIYGDLSNGVTLLARNSVFTQNDIDSGKISYTHAGGENSSDSFQVIVRDPANQSSAASTFSITVTPVNDNPVVLVNLGASLNEGADYTLTPSVILASDAEDNDPSLRFVIETVPNFGSLLRSGVPLANGGSFILSDVSNGFIVYRHNGSENLADTFYFHVQDSQGGQSPADVFAISINAINDLPQVVTNAGATLDEGASVLISDALLNSTDADDGATTLIYSLLQVPVNGTLRNGVTALNAGNTFTQSDINSGNIHYEHSGSETSSDSFQFSVRDPHGATAPSQTFGLTIDAVNDPPVLANNSGLTLDEGAGATINNTMLQATDVDSSTLTFTLSGAPAQGTLTMSGSALALNDTFTQAQIDGNSLYYQHSGNELSADNFRFTVSDGTVQIAEQVFPITVNPINDAPEILINSGLTVTEGGQGVIHNTQLSATDVDNNDSSLLYTLVSAPSHGTLSIGMSVVATGESFYQADIDAGNLAYQHDASQTTSDTFRVSVSDGTTIAPAINFNIVISATNNPPSLVTNAGLQLDEGADALISNGLLAATDADNDDAGLLYTLTMVPAHGQLYNYTVALNLGDSFTQGHIDTGRIHFVHDGGESTADQFQFTLADNSGAQSAPVDFLIVIDPINDLPLPVSNAGLSLNEGSTAVISSAALSYSDSEQAADALTYSITLPPTSGDIMLGASTVLGLGDSFTQADINQGVIFYRHAGGELPSDSFTFRVGDGSGEQTAIALFLITVNPVNDTPVIERNSTLYVTEGLSAAIDNSTLRSTDADNDNAVLLYTMTRLPAHGELRLNGNALALNGTFSQADINSLSVVFVHDDSESSDDNFGFTVRDPGGATSSAQSFLISVRAVNDPPVLVVNTGTNVMASQSITVNQNMLRATDSDNDDATLSYVITRLPTHGRLRKGITSLQVNGHVLQGDINSNQLVYVHNGDEGLNDSFAFVLRDDRTQLSETSFAITIGAVNDPPSVEINTGLTLTEGASVDIVNTMLAATDPDNDDATLIYTLVSPPSHGSLLLTGTALAASETFTQGDINSSRISYAHDGSEETSDVFAFRVADPQGATSAQASFAITVQSVNDTPTLINNGISLDEGATVIISSSQLRAQDPDSELSGLIFTVTALPAHGSVLSGVAPLMVGNTFTQGTIDQSRLSYQHDGGESLSDSFEFNVRDSGNAETDPQTFFFTILPVNDPPVIEGIEDQEITAGEVFTTFDLDDYVTDVDNSLSDMAYSASSSSHLNIAINAENVVSISVVDAAWSGAEVVTFSVDDGTDSSAQDVSFTVNEVPNQAPVWSDSTPSGTVTVEAETQLSFIIAADDPEGDPLQYTATDLPIGAVLNADTGEFGWTPLRLQIGTYSVTVRASDAEFTIERNIIIEVIEPVVADAGVVDAGGDEEPGGCGCAAQQSDRSWMLGLAMALALLWRRRQR